MECGKIFLRRLDQVKTLHFCSRKHFQDYRTKKIINELDKDLRRYKRKLQGDSPL